MHAGEPEGLAGKGRQQPCRRDPPDDLPHRHGRAPGLQRGLLRLFQEALSGALRRGRRRARRSRHARRGDGDGGAAQARLSHAGRTVLLLVRPAAFSPVGKCSCRRRAIQIHIFYKNSEIRNGVPAVSDFRLLSLSPSRVSSGAGTMNAHVENTHFNLHDTSVIEQPADADTLKAALRTLGGGVSIITAGEGEARTGAPVTPATVLSVAACPLLVC